MPERSTAITVLLKRLARTAFIGGLSLCCQLTAFSAFSNQGGKFSLPLRQELHLQQARSSYHSYAIPVLVQVEGEPDASSSKGFLRSAHAFAAKLTSQQIQSLESSPTVRYITLDPVIRTTSDRRQIQAVQANVQLQTIGATRARREGYGGQGITVALFDSGIGAHADQPACL